MSNQCPYEGSDVAARYLNGGLSEAEQERFEEHYFGCDGCFAEVNTGAEIRAAAALRPAASQPRRVWYAAAAAAFLVIVALPFAVDRYRSPATGAPVLRSPAASVLSLHLAMEGDEWTFRWNAHPEAVEYQIELFSEDGVLLLRHPTLETELTIDRGGIPRASARRAVYVRVRAFGDSGVVVSSSELERIEPDAMPL